MISSITARGFRNLEPLELELEPGAHLVLGANGAGKTSLLEAIYLLATTRSFRASRLADCCRHGESNFLLKGEVETEQRLQLEFGWSTGDRWRSVNGNRTSLAEHLAALPVICWTAPSTEILTGAPLNRRQFMDRGIIGLKPTAIQVISRYRQALHAKRRLLQQGGGEIETWNRVLADVAAELIALRSGYVERLQAQLALVLEQCDLGFPVIELGYRPSPPEGLGGSMVIEEGLNRIAIREQAAKAPLVGPHRDEMTISWGGHALRRVASAGERKALGIALIAAHGRTLEQAERHPVYLLDDADTELDSERLKFLWRAFASAEQLFATSNRAQIWDGIELRSNWSCSAGTISRR